MKQSNLHQTPTFAISITTFKWCNSLLSLIKTNNLSIKIKLQWYCQLHSHPYSIYKFSPSLDLLVHVIRLRLPPFITCSSSPSSYSFNVSLPPAKHCNLPLIIMHCLLRNKTRHQYLNFHPLSYMILPPLLVQHPPPQSTLVNHSPCPLLRSCSPKRCLQ